MKEHLSRREFIELTSLFGAAWSLAGCVPKADPVPITATSPEVPFVVPEKTPSETPQPTLKPSPTETPTLLAKTELETMVEKYGPAKLIPAFEYHGDNYSMYQSSYDMNPERFVKQMEWLKDHDFHAVTGPELSEFLEGKIDLPLRSVILTTDSGNTSMQSIPRMITVLKETNMHFLSFILTHRMDQGESVLCENDHCWRVFEMAANSGSFTLGTHSESHRDFASLSPEEGIADLYLSKQKIENRLGINVYMISWPYERTPEWADQLSSLGFKYAFGGYERPILECGVYKSDEARWHLPRILPPNTTGVSGRPKDKTLPEIMEMYLGKDTFLP